jgi:DNA-directed RNA polymerase specialized sigma24 family protein
MSKSYGNVIPLFAPEKDLRKLVMKIKTNSLEPGQPKDPSDSLLYEIYRAFATDAIAELDLAATADDDVLLKVDDAIRKLAAEDPEKAELVKLRFFAGLSIPDAAQAMGLSESTAKRHWAYCRAWLYDELTRDQ